jgi:pSer/pThr/pTyr-binding forkhead associated (FHA) protein
MSYQLRVISGDPPNGVFPLAEGETVIGRSPECGIVFESAGVSRQHFLIRVEGDRAVLENKGRFGTQVEDQPVEGRKELFPGDKIRFGMYMLVLFEEATGAGSGPADPDCTAELPAFYQPSLNQPPKPSRPAIGGDDSFFLRNDDLQLPTPSSTRSGTRTEGKSDPAPKPASSGADPSLLDLASGLQSLPGAVPPPRLSALPAAPEEELFSSPQALPKPPPQAPPSSRPPPPPPPPPAPRRAPPPPVDDGVHTRGLSPEAIAFMRQEWERKSRAKRLKFVLLGGVLLLAAAAAAWYFFSR